ncbi:hypothetical protein GH714_032463 [Hevea brasiliensis]|uniref:Uncharacterized protein n=1 Tax=Hevea brasiliensis TaxID=3981 RepID=A0A6A6M2C7_HEVBR|nr:hypothetical protein GH714_032463 [Hevea brasiliensis]
MPFIALLYHSPSNSSFNLSQASFAVSQTIILEKVASVIAEWIQSPRREVSDLLCWDLQDIAWSRVVSVARVAVLGWATLVVDNGQAMEEDGDGCSVKRLYSPMKIDEVEAFDLMVAEAGDHQANNEYTLVGRLLTDRTINFSAMRNTFGAMKGCFHTGFGIESLFDSIFHPVDLHRVIDGGRWLFNNHLLVTHHLQPREDLFIVELNEALF